MRFSPTPLSGLFVIEPELLSDERGHFSYSFDRAEFDRRGLPGTLVQSNISFNRMAGTVRGMHFQVEPYGQPKLVRCTAGRLFDVAVDLRPHSPTHRRWLAVELTADNRKSLFIPSGFAHGFQTLTDDTEVLYDMFAPYAPAAGRGVRFDDPAFAVKWPRPVTLISERDRTYADYV